MKQEEKYRLNMEELKLRFLYLESKVACVTENSNVYALEEIALHLRKILELIAYSSVFPYENEYIKLRESECGIGYRKDYNARVMLSNIEKTNPNFYPQPFEISAHLINKANRQGREVTPFKGVFLTRNNFEKLYDRLGKYLHAENPWGNDKGYNNFKKDLQEILMKIRNLLSCHFVALITEAGTSLWMVFMGATGEPVGMLTANSA